MPWASVSQSCGATSSPTFCTGCICGVGRALVTGLYAAGVDVGATQATLDGLLSTCTGTIGGALVANANLSAATLTALASCDVNAVAAACAAEIAADQGTRGNATTTTTTTGGSGVVAAANGPAPAPVAPAMAASGGGARVVANLAVSAAVLFAAVLTA